MPMMSNARTAIRPARSIPNQLFYMRQRGIPEAQARALLTEAFIAEALEEASESVRDAMLDAARSFLTETVR